MRVTIEGIQEAQAWNLRKMAALKPSGAMGRAILYGTTAAHRSAVSLTHVDTGALRASHRMQMFGEHEGQVLIDAGATNPSGQLTSVYGPAEHARGGSHAFYARTVAEDGPAIRAEMLDIIRTGVTIA